MSEILIRTPAELDEGECAGKPIVVAVTAKPGIATPATTVYASVSRRALRRLWTSVASLYLWVDASTETVRVTHIGVSEYEREALDGAVIE